MAELGQFIIRWDELETTRSAVLTYNEESFDPSVWDISKEKILDGKDGMPIGPLIMHGETILPFASSRAKLESVYTFHQTTIGEVFIYVAIGVADMNRLQSCPYWSRVQFIVTGPADWFRTLVAQSLSGE